MKMNHALGIDRGTKYIGLAYTPIGDSQIIYPIGYVITKFMTSLNYIIENQRIEIETVDEDFTSVQSGEIVSDFKKNATTDTISAMLILERRKSQKKSD